MANKKAAAKAAPKKMQPTRTGKVANFPPVDEREYTRTVKHTNGAVHKYFIHDGVECRELIPPPRKGKQKPVEE